MEKHKTKQIDTSLVDKAIIFAVKAHEGVPRRGRDFPYIVHPLEAMTIVATMTSEPEMLAASVLHDVVEDTDFTVEDIRAEFGDRVAELVDAETEKHDQSSRSREESWHDRKAAALEALKTAPRDVKIVALGDKPTCGPSPAIMSSMATNSGSSSTRRIRGPMRGVSERWSRRWRS